MIQIALEDQVYIQIEPHTREPGGVVLGVVFEGLYQASHVSLTPAQVQALIAALRATATACVQEAV